MGVQNLISLTKFRENLSGHPRSSAPHGVDEGLWLDCIGLQLLLPYPVALIPNKSPVCKPPSQYLLAIEHDLEQ